MPGLAGLARAFEPIHFRNVTRFADLSADCTPRARVHLRRSKAWQIEHSEPCCAHCPLATRPCRRQSVRCRFRRFGKSCPHIRPASKAPRRPRISRPAIRLPVESPAFRPPSLTISGIAATRDRNALRQPPLSLHFCYSRLLQKHQCPVGRDPPPSPAIAEKSLQSPRFRSLPAAGSRDNENIIDKLFAEGAFPIFGYSQERYSQGVVPAKYSPPHKSAAYNDAGSRLPCNCPCGARWGIK